MEQIKTPSAEQEEAGIAIMIEDQVESISGVAATVEAPPVVQEGVQFIPEVHKKSEMGELRIETNHVAAVNPLQSTKISTPIEPVQYVDEKTKVLGRMAELEELRKRSDLKKKKGTEWVSVGIY